jgi:hypothetical protein
VTLQDREWELEISSHRLFPHWFGNGRFNFRRPNRQPQTELERWWNAGLLRRTDISAYLQRLLAASGQSVLSIHSREKTVDLPRELYLPEDRLILLAIFAWHIMQQASEDAASAAAVVAATS